MKKNESELWDQASNGYNQGFEENITKHYYNFSINKIKIKEKKDKKILDIGN
jgi:hypothetical protein